MPDHGGTGRVPSPEPQHSRSCAASKRARRRRPRSRQVTVHPEIMTRCARREEIKALERDLSLRIEITASGRLERSAHAFEWVKHPHGAPPPPPPVAEASGPHILLVEDEEATAGEESPLEADPADDDEIDDQEGAGEAGAAPAGAPGAASSSAPRKGRRRGRRGGRGRKRGGGPPRTWPGLSDPLSCGRPPRGRQVRGRSAIAQNRPGEPAGIRCVMSCWPPSGSVPARDGAGESRAGEHRWRRPRDRDQHGERRSLERRVDEVIDQQVPSPTPRHSSSISHLMRPTVAGSVLAAGSVASATMRGRPATSGNTLP
jgi:hypothetical protein